MSLQFRTLASRLKMSANFRAVDLLRVPVSDRDPIVTLVDGTLSPTLGKGRIEMRSATGGAGAA